jgi:hypothetical protein
MFARRAAGPGGIFAGAEVPKTEEQVELYGGIADLPFDPATTSSAARWRTSTSGASRSTRTQPSTRFRRCADDRVGNGDTLVR